MLVWSDEEGGGSKADGSEMREMRIDVQHTSESFVKINSFLSYYKEWLT